MGAFLLQKGHTALHFAANAGMKAIVEVLDAFLLSSVGTLCPCLINRCQNFVSFLISVSRPMYFLSRHVYHCMICGILLAEIAKLEVV